jgi:hypothetical protein
MAWLVQFGFEYAALEPATSPLCGNRRRQVDLDRSIGDKPVDQQLPALAAHAHLPKVPTLRHADAYEYGPVRLENLRLRIHAGLLAVQPGQRTLKYVLDVLLNAVHLQQMLVPERMTTEQAVE